MCEFLGEVDGVAEAADGVDESEVEGSLCDDDSAVGGGGDGGGVESGELGACGEDFGLELGVVVVDGVLEDVVVGFYGGGEGACEGFVGCGGDGAALDSPAVHCGGEVEGLHDDADGAGEGGGLGEDLVAAEGDVVAAGCGDGAHGDDEGFAGALFEAADFGEHGFGGGDGASGGVDAEDDGFDAVVLFGE